MRLPPDRAEAEASLEAAADGVEKYLDHTADRLTADGRRQTADGSR
ncbi:hypothetical protein [Streptomyces sp. NPDC005890]